jgi:SNF2 family DNA or RNA helicase
MIELKEPYSILYGEIKDRAEQIDNFQTGRTRIFLGQITTGGLGITLTKATQVIYFENTFRLEDRLQSEDRAHRKGQINKVLYTDIVYKNTIDEHIIRAIRGKQEIAEQVLDCFTGTQVNIERKTEEKNNDKGKIKKRAAC